MRGPFDVGEKVLLLDAKGRRYLIDLEAGGEFHSHAGFVRHDELIGADEGSSVQSTMGSRFRALRPAPLDLQVHGLQPEPAPVPRRGVHHAAILRGRRRLDAPAPAALPGGEVI